MKKNLLIISVVFMVFSAFLIAACDSDSKSYKFKGTIELVQYPDEGNTLSLITLSSDTYKHKIIYRVILKDTKGDEITNATVSWGAENVSISDSNVVSFPDGRRMVINAGTENGGAAYTPGETISVKAAYGGVESAAKTITFIP